MSPDGELASGSRWQTEANEYGCLGPSAAVHVKKQLSGCEREAALQQSDLC